MGTCSSNVRQTMSKCNSNEFTLKYCNESFSSSNKPIITAIYEATNENALKGRFSKENIKQFLKTHFENKEGWSEFNLKRLSHPRSETVTSSKCNKTTACDDEDNTSHAILWSQHVLKNANVCIFINNYNASMALILNLVFNYSANFL